MPGATPLRESACRVSKTEVFAIFEFLEQPSAGIRLSSVKNWVFLRVLVWPVHLSQRKQGSSGDFLRFLACLKVFENCAHDLFCLIRPFFKPFPR